MLGDLINKFSIFWTRNILCRHEYQTLTRKIGRQTFQISECVYCGRVVVKEI